MEENTRKKTIGNYLASALDMEDHMSIAVYGEYMQRSVWPSNLSEEAFENIKKLLTVVIEETEMHKRMFSELQKKLNESAL
jgi:CRISPR/Cas system-associated endoribonuclease Cas2